MGRSTVYGACAASLALGLLFLFAWAPHPWGWEGFDHYHDLGRALARGGSFPTTDVPWGYAYYLAPFYAAFGDRPWIPLTVQIVLNASMPLLVYHYARREFDEKIAVTAAVLTGLLSFNTVYASTQSSDSLCTVLFMAAILAFARGRRCNDWRWHALAGAILGLAPQFRPNLILVPAVLALLLVIERRSARRAAHGGVLLVAAAAALTPWMLRNHALAGEPIPTSTHGGIQLWYGTLQIGPYLKSFAYNPRRVFEAGAFPYTSLDHVPLVLRWSGRACGRDAGEIEYWTDRDALHRRVRGVVQASGELGAELPPSPAPTAYYFRFPGGGVSHVFLISTDHLRDMDRHGDLLDVFDVVRMMRHAAWEEPLTNLSRLDFDRDGRVTATDVVRAAGVLLGASSRSAAPSPAGRFAADAAWATLHFADASHLAVPRRWAGLVTDLDVSGAGAARLLHAWVPFSAVDAAGDGVVRDCDAGGAIAVNTVFYRGEPHAMRRYLALALDNIRRDPAGYLRSAAYRAVRVFFIEGSDDPQTAQQFSGSGRVYAVAHAGSIALMALALAGMVIAWRRGYAIVLPLVLIAYIPATLAFVLTNMRYSVTVQPFVFMFAAVTILSALEALGAMRPSAPGRATETGGRAGARTTLE